MEAHPELKELPRVKELSAEYSEVLERKKKTYAEYRKNKNEAREWQIADSIAQMIREGTNPERKRNSLGGKRNQTDKEKMQNLEDSVSIHKLLLLTDGPFCHGNKDRIQTFRIIC